MTADSPKTERLNAFSDGVFAVVITILALDFRPPHAPSLDALFEIWPTVISYAVSYLFIAIVWVNHHHLLRYAGAATPRLIWGNFAHLFSVSLLPFSTAWIASSRLSPLPVAVYAGIFALVNATYLLLCWESVDRPAIEAIPGQARMMMRMRSLTTLLGFLAAVGVSLHYPMLALAMICICLATYLKPQVAGHAPRLASEDTTTPQAARHPSSGTERCLSSPESRPQQRPNRPA
ncbi:putative membrane protein [Bradyrhizobium sp. JR1.5]